MNASPSWSSSLLASRGYCQAQIEAHEAAKARRARMSGPATVMPVLEPPKPPREHVERDVAPIEFPPSWRGKVEARRIMVEVSKKWGLTVAEMIGVERKPRFAHARQEAMYRLRSEMQRSMCHIGRMLGNRDHSSVEHGIRAHANRNGLPIPGHFVGK